MEGGTIRSDCIPTFLTLGRRPDNAPTLDPMIVAERDGQQVRMAKSVAEERRYKIVTPPTDPWAWARRA